MVKILHTGDLHLDSPMSNLELSAAEAARDEHRRVFEKMMRYAIDEKVDILLISGDLFDGKYVTQHTRSLVIKYFSEFARPIVIAPGNHDPYSAISLYRDGSLPENVYVFSSEDLQVFDFDELGISVYGYAFITAALRSSPLSKFIPKPYTEGENRRILCAHADVFSPISNYAPVTVPEIEGYSFSYAALGHVHNPPQIKSDKTLINYSGFLFGRSFDEIGEGGAYLVTVDENKTDAERIVFSNHKFIKDMLDVSGARDNAEIQGRIAAFISEQGYGKDTSLSLSLVGTLPLELVVNKKLLEVNDTVSSLKIKDVTTPLPDGASLISDPTLRGEIYRTLLPKLSGSDAEERKLAAEALRLALCAIDGTALSGILQSDEEGAQ